MKRYSRYKNTNIEWIGEIPEHWKVYRVKNLVNSRKYYQIGDGDHGAIKPEMYCEEGIPYIRVQNLSWNGEIIYKGIVYIPKEIHEDNPKSHLFPGDILIAKTGATIGKLGMIPREMSTANTTSSVAKISVDRKRFDNKYILYSFMSPNFREQLKLVASQKSAQPGFNNNELVDFYISVPTKGEQIQISSYLDNKTSLIDKLINNNKKLIKLLEEKRTALINKVVTKGLDPNVKMKDSGIEWIGEIPEHWLVGKVRWYFEIGRGRVIANRDLDEDGKYPVYSSQTKNNGAFGFLNTYDFEGKYLTWTTDGANAGTVSYREGRFNCTNVCGTLKSSRDINLEYYGYFLNQATNWFVRKDINPKLMNNVMAGIPIPLPSLSEQIQISSYLDNKTSLIDKAIKEIKNKNIFLEEYRQSLISNVVTGKIKVANL